LQNALQRDVTKRIKVPRRFSRFVDLIKRTNWTALLVINHRAAGAHIDFCGSSARPSWPGRRLAPAGLRYLTKKSPVRKAW